jgi:hypothetical protein
MAEQVESPRLKRRFPRLEAGFPLRIGEIEGEVRDLSVMSFRFVTNQPVSEGETKRVTLRTTGGDGQEKIITAKIYIHWCKPVSKGKYLTGAEVWSFGHDE